jgi:cytochrome c-type biogenesis protein
VTAALTAAFSTGALAAFNPCGFALLPGWAAVLVSGERGGDDLFARLVRALRAGLVATIAFLLVFGLAGLVFSLGFAAFGRYLAFVGLAIGLVLASLGTLLLVDGHAPGLNVGPRAGGGTGTRTVFGFGIAYALGSLSCVLPVFVLTLGIVVGEPFWTRVGDFLGFALGMGTVLALIAIAAALTGEGALKLRGLVRLIPRLAGAVVVGAAAVVLARELGLAALSLGHHQPSLTVRVAVAVAATAFTALTAVAVTRGRVPQLEESARQPVAEATPGTLRGGKLCGYINRITM